MLGSALPQSLTWVLSIAAAALWGCAGGDDTSSGGEGGQGGWTTGGSGGAATGGFAGTGGATGGGGHGGGSDVTLDALLDGLRSDLHGTMQLQSDGDGWPAPVRDGFLFVSAEAQLHRLGGDHEGWSGTPMSPDQGFHWLVVDVPADTQYKFTDGSTWQADPWSRSYRHDAFGVMSLVTPTAPHLDRFFNVTDGTVAPRTVRVWVPTQTPTHLLYMHDGQNLFDPDAMWGGWQLDQSLPAAMMIVGVDNTADRMDEYTHVADDLGGAVGGGGDVYADFVQLTVRQLVRDHYAEPSRIGVMGSSLGGLISFHIALRHAGEYDFAGSMSGTLGWGSIGLSGGQQNETMIERYQAAGHGSTALYLDSGGNGTCYDGDGDGIEDDDPSGLDNYCETRQLESVLYAVGYTANVDVWHWWETDAPHNEAAWGSRVHRPLDHFAAM